MTTSAVQPSAPAPAPPALTTTLKTTRTGQTAHGRRVLRLGAATLLVRPRSAVLSAVLLVAVLLLAGLSLTRGDVALSPGQVLAVLEGGGTRLDRFVVLDLRLPRVLTAVLVGAALGLSGALAQSITRNALASPDVLGITGGASVAAVSVIVIGGSASGSVAGAAAWLGVPALALVGGLVVAAAVYGLAWRGGVDGYRLVLVGISLASLCTAVTSLLLLRAGVDDAQRIAVWLFGSLNGRGWEHVVPLALVVPPALLATAFAGRTLEALRYGEDTTVALGVRLQTGRAVLLLLAVVLAAVATAAAGPIAFLALVSPQIALRLARSAGPPLLASALVGSLVLVAADLVARTVLPVELPVGIVTAVIGAPYLLHLLLAAARKATS